MDHDEHQQPQTDKGIIFRARWAFIAFIAIAAYFLILEHKAHLSGVLYYWPLLLLLACPLLHVFMHRGHRRHGSPEHNAVPKAKGGTK
jgi:Flp pilus assembly protein TadB